jgi:NADH-ubiquinone oxidoreductase chain 5
VLTIIISGLRANYEYDLKKIIALSTLSQLGVIIISISLGIIDLSFFHLITHALFKSLLFICAGIYIHRIKNNQDIRYFRKIEISLPLTSIYFIGASIALVGFPFLAGFYSKDIIMEMYFIRDINSIYLILIVFSTILTLTYRVRLFFFIFLKNLRIKSFIFMEENKIISYPISVLFFIRLMWGSYIS